MRYTCETVTIKTSNGLVDINKTDYDAKIHTLAKKPVRKTVKKTARAK